MIKIAIKVYFKSLDGNDNLTKNFKVKEFACKDGTDVIFIDTYLVEILQILRNTLKEQVIITSGYRTPEHNKKVDGAMYSYHIRGMAADIKVPNKTPKEVAKELDKMLPNECGIIVYKSWVHFDTRSSRYRKGV